MSGAAGTQRQGSTQRRLPPAERRAPPIRGARRRQSRQQTAPPPRAVCLPRLTSHPSRIRPAPTRAGPSWRGRLQGPPALGERLS